MKRNENWSKKELSGGLIDRRDLKKIIIVIILVALTISISGPLFLARAADPEIRIGHTAALSGVYSLSGNLLDKGLRLAFSLSKYKNRVKFFLEDTQVKPDLAVQKALKLYEKDKIHILVGPLAGHEAAAVSAVLRPMKKLMVEGFGANSYLVGKDCSPYTFMLGHTTYNLSAPMAPWFLKTLGDKVFLVGADYSTGRDVARFFREAFEKIGGRVVGEFYSPLGLTEYAPYLSQIRNAKEKPDGIFGFYGGADVVNFVRQFEEYGLKKDGYIYIDSINGMGLITLAPMGDAPLGFYDCFHTVPYIDNPQNQIFMNAWQKEYPSEMIEEFGMMGFDVGTCIIKALDAVGGDPTNTEALASVLHTIEYESPRGKIRMGPNNGTIVPIYARKVVKKDGKYRHEATLLGYYGTPCGPQYEWGECKLGCPSN
jgi:branched-chain amino acid transport system substrate-binding protein